MSTYKYECIVLDLKPDSFTAQIIELDDITEIPLQDVDETELDLVKPGVCFFLLIDRYRRVPIFKPSQSNL